MFIILFSNKTDWLGPFGSQEIAKDYAVRELQSFHQDFDIVPDSQIPDVPSEFAGSTFEVIDVDKMA